MPVVILLPKLYTYLGIYNLNNFSPVGSDPKKTFISNVGKKKNYRDLEDIFSSG